MTDRELVRTLNHLMHLLLDGRHGMSIDQRWGVQLARSIANDDALAEHDDDVVLYVDSEHHDDMCIYHVYQHDAPRDGEHLARCAAALADDIAHQLT